MDLLVSQADLESHISAQKVVQLADDDRDGIADTVVIADVCEKATALINDTLEPRYGAYVPFAAATAPAILNHLARDIGAFELYARRNVVPEVIQYRYELALQRLKEYAKGSIPLIVESTPLVDNTDDVVSSTAYEDRTFTRDTLADFARGPL